MLVGWSILLIIHGILAVFLLGAITHQAVGVSWPVPSDRVASSTPFVA